MGPSGFVAVIAGWITTEVGRQPFTIYGLLRTADSASPLAAPAVGASLIAFVIVYFAVFGMGTLVPAASSCRARRSRTSPSPPNAPAHAAGITPAPALAAARTRRAVMADSTAAHQRLGRHPRVRRVHVRRHGRLRSRHRHPVSGVRRRPGARHRDELHRAGVGRQRDLAGAGRRRIAGRVSAGVLDRAVGAVRAVDRDAARRWCFAASRSNSAGAIPAHRAFWDFAFTAGSLVAAFAQGITLGALLQGIHGRGPRLWRRLVGLAHAVQPADRRERGRGLLPARCLLAELEDRRRDAEACAPPDAHPRAAHAGRHPRREPRDAVPRRRSISTAGSRCRACCSPRRCR